MTQWTKTGSNLNLSHKLCMHEVALIDEGALDIPPKIGTHR